MNQAPPVLARRWKVIGWGLLAPLGLFLPLALYLTATQIWQWFWSLPEEVLEALTWGACIGVALWFGLGDRLRRQPRRPLWKDCVITAALVPSTYVFLYVVAILVVGSRAVSFGLLGWMLPP